MKDDVSILSTVSGVVSQFTAFVGVDEEGNSVNYPEKEKTVMLDRIEKKSLKIQLQSEKVSSDSLKYKAVLRCSKSYKPRSKKCTPLRSQLPRKTLHLEDNLSDSIDSCDDACGGSTEHKLGIHEKKKEFNLVDDFLGEQNFDGSWTIEIMTNVLLTKFSKLKKSEIIQVRFQFIIFPKIFK